MLKVCERRWCNTVVRLYSPDMGSDCAIDFHDFHPVQVGEVCTHHRRRRTAALRMTVRHHGCAVHMPRPLIEVPVRNLSTPISAVSTFDEPRSIGRHSYREVEALWFPHAGVEGAVKCKRDTHECVSGRSAFSRVHRVSAGCPDLASRSSVALPIMNNINCNS